MIIEALKDLGITSEFVVDGDAETEEHYLKTYKDLTDSNRFIEWSVLKAKMDQLQAEYEANQYQRDRLTEYPSIQECIHAILDDDLEALQAKRSAVKAKYPKPE
jgi:hypothetical protein